jgi:F-type H+-transporting ATPase subunit a
VHLLVHSAGDVPPFHGPTIDEFFPPAFLFEGTPFEVNRIMMVRVIVALIVVVLFWFGTRRMRVVPSRTQSVVEFAVNFVRVSIVEDLLGKKDGRRFLPLITAIFFTVLAMNVLSIIPGANIAGTSVIGVPLLLAVVAYVAFIYAGVKKHPAGFFRNALFPKGVPIPLYILITPIEFVSTFIVRPFTLTLRLMMNMIVGHLLLVLFFTGTSWFLFAAPGLFKVLSIGTFAFGFAFTLFELLIIGLQAYIFALLTTVYIQLALAEEH